MLEKCVCDCRYAYCITTLCVVRCMLRACLPRKFLTANVCSLVCVFQSTYSFFVYDWDGTNTIDDDFLGVAHLSLRKVRDLRPTFVTCAMMGVVPLNPWTVEGKLEGNWDSFFETWKILAKMASRPGSWSTGEFHTKGQQLINWRPNKR